MENLRSEFAKRSNVDCKIFRAPGRVNLIGEHTDYNDGYVMPVAIGFDTYVACANQNSGNVVVESLQDATKAAFPTQASDPQPAHDWSDYVRGVLLELERLGISLTGADLLIDGRVPIGAGLSSSAAIEVAAALAFLELAHTSMGKVEVAKLCQRAENVFVGSRCGIMDQFASLHGRAGHAVLLDCRSLEFDYLPIPAETSLVICNSMVKHSLAAGEYNTRRAECETGVQHFAQRKDGIKALRDVTEDDLERHSAGLSPVLLRRCRHVVTENARVLRAADALKSGELETFGRLMYESHASLRRDFEVSCLELDILVELASNFPGVYGARMTGGGFGGCTINLVERAAALEFRDRIREKYFQKTGILPEVYITQASDGAGLAG